MGKIVFLCGKSSCGKDTVFKALVQGGEIALQVIVPYTTRPVRSGEKEGREYFFTDEDGFSRLMQEGRVIECRTYHTCFGPWRYFTVDDGQIDLAHNNYIVIGTLEAYLKMKDYFGEEQLIPVYIELEDGERLYRALCRERQQETPRYEELCRRFLADSQDFSEEKIRQAGIERRFQNEKLETCLAEITEYLTQKIQAQG